jgi:hypothetical protein
MRIFLAALSLLLLARCGQPAALTPPAALPTASLAPAITATSTIFIAETETIAMDIETIDVRSPGPDSVLTSPIQLHATLAGGALGHAEVSLLDASGRILARQVLPVVDSSLHVSLPFEISPQPARLVLRTQDAYGRTQALRSLAVTLLAEGSPSLHAPEERPALQLSQPSAGQSLSSGRILIQGDSAGTQPLSITAIGRNGRVLAAGSVYPQPTASGANAFATSLALTVNEPTWVQIALSEYAAAGEMPTRFIAVEVLLLP